MTLNTMSVNDFRVEVESAYKELVNYVFEVKQPVETIGEQPAENDASAESPYIRLQIFDEIFEPVYTIKYEGYEDKNGKTINDETFIKHFTSENMLILMLN